MRNLKKVLALAVASVMLMGMMVVGTSAAYEDVVATDNIEAIGVLEMVGVMSGDDKGNFNPAKNVTRNEMAVIMSNLMDLDVEDYTGSTTFTDVPAWAEPYVAACYANGIVSGTSATTYGGDGSVTTAQAALMLMKGLGYFQYASDFENDWQLATVKQGSKIKLFDGIETGAATALTRNDVALMVLNALKANVVEANVSGNNTQINAGDVSITVTANVSYDPITIQNEGNANYDATQQNPAGVGTQQLVEKLFNGTNALTVDTATTDDFSRPSTTWSYKNDTVEVADKADLTYTAAVKGGALYTALGKPANAQITIKEDNQTAQAPNNFAIASGNKVELGANGQLIEVYETGTSTYTIVIVNTYVGTITTHTDAVTDKDGDITTKEFVVVDDAANSMTFAQNGDKFETTAFVEKDEEDNTVVLFTAAGDGNNNYTVKSVVAAEKVTAEVSKIVTGKSITAGKEYAYSAKIYVDQGQNTAAVVEKDADIYLDTYGYAIQTALAAGETADATYAYVINADAGYGIDPVPQAKLLFADGTVKVVTTKQNYSGNNGLVNHLVSYTVKDGKYELTDAADASQAQNVSITKNTPAYTVGNAAVASDKTIFLVETQDNNQDPVYTVYTGYANVPSISGNVASATYTEQNKSFAAVVYVNAVNATVNNAAATSALIYVIGDANAALVTDANGTYKTYNAIVDGKITTLDIANSIIGQNNGQLNMANTQVLKSITVEDGIVEGFVAATSQGQNADYATATGTVKAADSLIGLGTQNTVYKAYTADCAVYMIEDGEATTSTVSAIKTDANDTVIYTVNDDGYVTALYIVVVANP